MSGSGDRDLVEVPAPPDPGELDRWCAVALDRLAEGRPEAALEAARRAVEHDSRDGLAAGWGYRLASLAFERLGRDAEAVAAAEEAVRLAPGSWAARLRLGSALRRVPGRWAESWSQTARAVRYAPEEPDPHVLAGTSRSCAESTGGPGTPTGRRCTGRATIPARGSTSA
ncbi:hypothetical protein [Planomonospora algeriensis]